MAAKYVNARSGQIASGTADRVILLLTAPANQSLRIIKWGLTMQGTAADGEPIEVQLCRFGDAGTTPVAVTETILNEASGTILTVATQGIWGTDPATPTILDSVVVHPQSGVLIPILEKDSVIVPGGGFLGIRVIAPAATVDVVATIDFEE